MRRWLKFHLRKYFKPMDKIYAHKQRQRLAAIYFFLTWNTAGLLLYYCLKQSYPMTEQEKQKPSLWYLRLAGVNNVEITQYDGFKRMNRLEYTNYGENVTVLPLNSESEDLNNLIVDE